MCLSSFSPTGARMHGSHDQKRLAGARACENGRWQRGTNFE